MGKDWLLCVVFAFVDCYCCWWLWWWQQQDAHVCVCMRDRMCVCQSACVCVCVYKTCVNTIFHGICIFPEMILSFPHCGWECSLKYGVSHQYGILAELLWYSFNKLRVITRGLSTNTISNFHNWQNVIFIMLPLPGISTNTCSNVYKLREFIKFVTVLCCLFKAFLQIHVVMSTSWENLFSMWLYYAASSRHFYKYMW